MSFFHRVMALVKSGNIPIRHGAQQQSIRKACQIARDVLIKTAAQVHVGATTAEIDRFAADLRAVLSTVGRDNAAFINATGIATALLGNAIAANMFVLGYAFQKGRVPLSSDAIKRAIEQAL